MPDQVLLRVAEIVPDISTSELEDSYTYQIPDGMEIARGDTVLVPFGARTVVGFVVRVWQAQVQDFDFRLRSVQERVSGLTLPEEVLKLIDFVESEFVASAGSAFAAAMPPGTRNRLTTEYVLGTGEATTPAQRLVLEAVSKKGKLSEHAMRPFAKSAVKALLAKGALQRVVGIPAAKKRTPSVVVTDEADARERLLSFEFKRLPAQAQCLSVLLEAPRTGLTSSEAAALAGVSEATVRALLDSGILSPAPKEDEPLVAPRHRLNEGQRLAVEALSVALRAGSGGKFLLFGITGSGKTEVYLRAIAEALAMGKRALYLVPEIALTAQVVGTLRERFGAGVAVMHSGLSAGERLRSWQRAASGEAPIVVGARSAIFAPITNLGIIVVDEEHDGSYKQDSAPRYDVRALAEMRAAESDAVLVYGSATPSVTTFHRAEQGEIKMLRLPVRAATESLPSVQIEDLREAYKERKPSMLSARLRQGLAETFGRGEQAILFINRRAFARSLLCRDCGFTPTCPNCSVALTFHARPLHLRCHHCNHKERVEDRCQQCGSLRIRPLGIGTQKVEEVLRHDFPEARIERLDRDTAARKGAVEEILARVRSGETQALVGTQMIAKGLDFENVTLVGVIAADVGLAVPDYRSGERTFQLLTQVAGRSGRKKPGTVVVQTFAPDHPSIRFAAEHDFEGFFRDEIRDRQEASYPPFVRLVNFVVSGPDRDVVTAAAGQVRDQLEARFNDTVTVYGPAECALARLHGNWRSHVLLKVPLDFPMSALPRPKDFDVSRPQRVTVDVDPSSLM